ncbi:pyridoxal phosphate-dependent aminotransferase [Desulfopila inferna]|uniref:pyridoxal phosphate-dependent aminotransferase n=1 Tax=Desulfopila inferna TaxID=468528 RepID=UPI001966332B|nr:pyridoxal phosphate-dependent aminotransferase [Desulfopila inferna]MBM9603214.1 pyridoxal phosphate-dependent aminotransferase [Desulfopila inferna]
MAVSEKMRQFAEKSSWIRKMFEEGAKLKAKHGADNVFDFSLGNPDLPPPPEFDEILQRIAGENIPGGHAYMPNGGYPWVREAVAVRISSEQGVAVSGAEMLMTCGAAGALNVVLKTLLDPGEEVILLSPYFVEYNFYVDNHGGISRVVTTDDQFNLDFNAIEAALNEKTKAIIVNSPNNPTGQIYPQKDLDTLGRLLEEAGNRFGTTIYLIADEPYRKIVFKGNTVPSIFQAYTNSIVLSSYSKDLSLPGERIGYLAVHPQILEKQPLLNAMTLANRILGFVNAPALMQKVVAELQDVTIDCTIYEKRRDIFCDILEKAGYDFLHPKGALYLFPRSPIADDVAFCAILQENMILAVPGRGFGAPGYFRLAFCTETKVIEGSAPGFAKAIAQARA